MDTNIKFCESWTQFVPTLSHVNFLFFKKKKKKNSISGLLYPSTYLYIHSIQFWEFAIKTPTKSLNLPT